MVDPQERVLVAAPGDTRFVQVYALPKRAHELDVGHACLRVVFSPDGTRVATAGEGAVKIWNPFGKRRGPSRLYLPPTWTLEVDGAVVTDVAFAPDGGTCATASSDGVLRIWPAERRDGRPHPTHALAFELAFAFKLIPCVILGEESFGLVPGARRRLASIRFVAVVVSLLRRRKARLNLQRHFPDRAVQRLGGDFNVGDGFIL